ncbi:MAG TPA: dihydrodipicolinate synthase family protein, partial [Edaphobacter sp.]
MLLEGLHLPLTTPFYPDGRLNLRKLEHNVDRYSRTPISTLVALSQTGEPTLLTDEETREALSTVMSVAGESKVAIAGIGRDSVTATLDLADFAAMQQYDAVLIQRPSILQELQRREALTYFQSIADRSPLPVVLYSLAANPLPVDLVAELASHPNVLGLTDESATADRIASLRSATAHVQREVTVTHVFAAATGRMLSVKASNADATFVAAEILSGGAALATAPPRPAIRTRSKNVGFQIVAATSTGMLTGLRAGATGAMPAFAASAPQACYEVYAAWKDNDQPLADEKQTRIAPAIAKTEQELGIPGIRYASDLTGYFGGRPRLPFLPLTEAQRLEIETVMAGIRH